MNTHIPLLSEELRPKILADLNLPESHLASFNRMVERKSILNLLFYGKPGIGKTSAARILLHEIDADVYELNGSFNKGDKTMLSGIEAFASTLSIEGRPKVCFIDEADYIPTNVQASLRYLIEKVSANTRFLLTANDVDRLSPAVRSRCVSINFDVFPTDVKSVVSRMVSRYQERLAAIGHEADPDRIHKIVSVYFPDLREIANRLELELV
jgi:replication factor C subunit 3/5